MVQAFLGLRSQEPRNNPYPFSVPAGWRANFRVEDVNGWANQKVIELVHGSLSLPLPACSAGLYAVIQFTPMSQLAYKYAHIAFVTIIHPPLVYAM